MPFLAFGSLLTQQSHSRTAVSDELELTVDQEGLSPWALPWGNGAEQPLDAVAGHFP